MSYTAFIDQDAIDPLEEDTTHIKGTIKMKGVRSNSDEPQAPIVWHPARSFKKSNPCNQYYSFYMYGMDWHQYRDHVQRKKLENYVDPNWFITRSELNRVKKGLRINIIEDHDNKTKVYDTSILKNINTKVCNTYIPLPADSENLNASTSCLLANPPCCCGREKDDQVHKIKRESQSKEWKSSEHTESIPSEVWGKLALGGLPGLADVLQLSDETDMAQLNEVLTESFKFDRIGPIVSLLGSESGRGSDDYLEMSYKLRGVLERSLPKAAVACDGWIISSGLDGELGGIVLDGIRKHGFSPYNIWITSWGDLQVERRETMIKQANVKKKQANIAGSIIIEPPIISVSSRAKSNSLSGTRPYEFSSSPLQYINHLHKMEQNHTAMLMVDNGQIDSPEAIDDVIKFRIKFENFFADKYDLPLISVLFGGGYETMEVLITRLQRNDKIIILAKSGGVASVLHKLKKHIIWIRSQQSGYTEPTHFGNRKRSKSKNEVNCTCYMESGAVKNIKSCSYITQKICKHMTGMKNHTLFILLELAVEKEYNIFVFDVRNNMEFEQVLLNAMVESTDNAELRLMCAFELGSPEELEKMLPSEAIYICSVTKLMINAILENRPAMLNVFLKWYSTTHFPRREKGTLVCSHPSPTQKRTTNFLSVRLRDNIAVLYEGACFARGGDHLIRLYDLISYRRNGIAPPGSSIGIFEPETETEAETESAETVKFPEHWNREALGIIDGCINELAGQSFNSHVGSEEDVFFELTIWSVMMLRKEMALMFCQRTEDPIRCALLCLKLMLNLNRNKVIVNVGESDKLSQLREAFESLAICTLEACYSTNPEMTSTVARCKWVRIKNYDYLELAYEAKCKRFIAHPVCQDISDRRWRVGFVKDEGFLTILAILLVALFPPLILIPKLIQFDSFATHDEDGKERIWWDKIYVRFKIIGKSPMIKFLMNGVCSLAFIILHLRVLYLDTNPVINRTVNSSSWTYIYLLLAWYCLRVIEEVIQVKQDTPHYWWKSVWNKVDLVVYAIYPFGLGLCIAFICTDDTGTCSLSTNMTGYIDCGGETGICDPSRALYVHLGRIMLSLVTALMFLRCSVFISGDLTLGPIILMLLEMCTTFAYFFVIFCIVLVGFGAAYIGLLVQVGQFNYRNVIGMVYYTYFQSLGELFLDVIEKPESQYLNKADPARDMTDWWLKSDINTYYYYASLLLLVIFMIISSLMLLNILIAMFTKSYERINSNQMTIWKFQRYSLLRDYENKFLPVPLSAIHYLLYLFRNVYRNYCNKKFITYLDSQMDEPLRGFVNEGLQRFIKERNSNSSKYDKYAIGL